MDRYCNRHFFALSATRKFDGGGTPHLLIPDLISVDASGLKTDDNKDRTFETTWATTDYLLLPSNADPTTRGNPTSRPYARLWVDLDAGTKADFPTGRETVQIAGQWGYWRHLKTATETVSGAVTASATTINVDARADVEAGHTLLIDSEQVYVKSYTGNALTVERGVNGTTAASHSDGASVQAYEYPGPIAEAVMMQAGRLWRRKDSAFGAPTGLPETGQATVAGRLDPDVALLMSQYRKLPVGA